MLKLNNITVSVEGKAILKNFSYIFKPNTVYAIMGPNGSGKSTLAHIVMGHPAYTLEEGSITLNGTLLNELSTDKRAKAGIFLGMQTPLSLQGVKPYQLLQMSMEGANALEVRKQTDAVADKLHIPRSLLSRSLNEGASGGERKKLEVLQAAVLNKPVQIFDEVDTGVDVDALKTIGSFLNTHKEGKIIILITHYYRILAYVKPDVVLVIMNGTLVKEGGSELAKEIEEHGYKHITIT